MVGWAALVWIAVGTLGCQSSAPPSGSAPSGNGDAPAEPAPKPPLAPTAAGPSTAARPYDFGADDPPEARRARDRLVRQIASFGEPWDGSGPWEAQVLTAMRTVPRHLFMPGASLTAAYADRPEPIGFGQTISQPTVVAIMTDALALKGNERVLEIGTGSGYQAAVLAMLCREVYSIEIIDPLGRVAKQRLDDLGYRNVQVRIGDGYLGWPEHAPFDRIILTAAPPEMPPALVEQLAEGGMIVAPVGEEDQRLVRWTKTAGRLEKRDLGSVRFVPMVRGTDESGETGVAR
jgi:protein-L-isoaspartate(D-aspartate) O-methyltransferase